MQYKLSLAITTLGAVIVVLIGILGWVVIPKVIDDKIAEETQLKQGSETMEKWTDIPYPIYLTFYVFHVTNPDDVENGATPVLEERGPYAYEQKRAKINLRNSDVYNPQHTLQYQETKTYFFDQKMSGTNSEEDLVDIINIAYVSVVHGVKQQMDGLTELVANNFLGTERLIRRNVKVGDLLFKGFDVSLYTKNPVLALALPEEFSEGRFGLYKTENGTASKIYNIYTGVGGHENFGIIKTYDGKDQLEFWQRNTPCDQLQGTDGTIYPPFLKKDRLVEVFSSDLCRSLTFTYEEESEHLDIPTYRFTVPKWELEDPRKNRENMCYCLTPENEDACPKAGAISLSGCRDGAPIMMSTPYFLDGDEGYRTDAGLPKANPDLHLTYLDIEPNSGVLLKGHKRIQVNIDVQLDSRVKAYQGLKKNIVFPLVWADEYAAVDEESADDLKGKLLKPLKIVDIAKWVVLGVGIAVIAVGGILFFIKRRQQGKETV